MVSIGNRPQLGALETGLKSLQSSQLMNLPEFQYMYNAIRKHHKEEKLSRLSGKAKDLMKQGEKDTEFYLVLSKMLCEVAGNTGHTQVTNLNAVYSWYKLNGTQLKSTPRFGKAKEENLNSVFRKDIRDKPLSRKNVLKSKSCSAKKQGVQMTHAHAPTPTPVERSWVGSETGSVSDGWTISRTPSPLTAPPSLTDLSDDEEMTEVDHDIVDHYTSESSSVLTYFNKRGWQADSQTGSRSDSPLHRHKASPRPHSRNRTKKTASSTFSLNVKHPISSIVNPHGTPRDKPITGGVTSGKENQSQDMESRKVKFRASRVVDSRSAMIATWKEIQNSITNSQDVLGKLSFVGRSGTPYDVRYVAHDDGEMPELNTSQVLSAGHGGNKQRHINSATRRLGSGLLDHSLGEFYELTEGYYPPRRPSRSAPLRGRGQGVSPAGTLQENQLTKPPHDMKMTTLMGAIDSVTANMNHFKEKMAPRPQPGFRQPSGHTLEVQPAPAASQGSPPSPTNRPVSVPAGATHSHVVSARNRPASSCYRPQSTTSTRLLSVSSPQLGRLSRLSPETPKRPSSPAESSKPSCASSTQLSVPGDKLSVVLDWRGKVSPDVVSHKWKKAGFGGHSYIQSLKQKKRVLSASKRRPKTAPDPAVRHPDMATDWNAHNNQSQPSRRVSHAGYPTTPVSLPPRSQMSRSDSRLREMDQDDVDQLMTIKYLGGTSEEFGAWFEYDADLLLHLSQTGAGRGRHQRPVTPPNLQYLSLVTPKSAIVGERNLSRPNTAITTRDTVIWGEDVGSSLLSDTDANSERFDPCDPDSDLQFDLQEDGLECQEQEKDVPYGMLDPENVDSLTAESHPAAVSLKEGNIKEGATADEPPAVSSDKPWPKVEPIVTDLVKCEDQSVQQKCLRSPLHSHTVSDPWTSSLVIPKEYWKEVIPKRPLTGRAKLTSYGQSVTNSDTLTEEMFNQSSSRRSAGRSVLSRSRSAGVQASRLLSRKPGDLAPPPRTAPSIPSHHQGFAPNTPRQGHAYMPELESYARRKPDSLECMENVKQLRSVASAPSHAPQRENVGEDLTSGLLTVCHLPRPDRADSTLAITYTTGEEVKTEGILPGEEENGECEQSEDDNSEESSFFVTSATPQSLGVQCGKQQTKREEENKPHSEGRPIPSYLEAHDPEEIAVQVQRQKEAKAVVDIQRIFRGYVARNYYTKLQRAERERREDEQKAAVAIQRAFKQHIGRMREISNRPRLDPELEGWAREYHRRRREQEGHRQAKRQEAAMEMSQNQYRSSAKISVIGPHVEIYQIYHQKKTGPTMALLHRAATTIQRYTRGMLVRNRLTALKRKAVYQGSSWARCVHDYRHTLRTVQERHGVIRPKMPFTFQQLNQFMDTRRKYESIFEKKAFGGEIEVTELGQFFKECDLCPSQAEMDDAVDVVVRGEQEHTGRGLYKGEVMEVLYHIYPPPAAGLTNHRRSTWMNPIIDGEEANKLIGSEFVEDAPLSVCIKLVVDSKRERREREQTRLDEQRTTGADNHEGSDEDEGEGLTVSVPSARHSESPQEEDG